MWSVRAPSSEDCRRRAVVASGLETEVQNTGEAAVFDLLEERIKNAERTMANLVATGLFSDGTGSGGKQLTGLLAMCDSTPLTTVYGGAVSSYERIGKSILSQMEQLASDQTLVRYLLVKDANGFIDQQGLIDFVGNDRQLLNLNYLAVIGPDGKVLARGHDPGLFGDDVSNDPVFAEALKGQKVQSLAKISDSGEDVLTVLGLTPIWYNNSQLIGVLAGGTSLDEEFCRHLRDLSGAEILLAEGNVLLAKTIAGQQDEIAQSLCYFLKAFNIFPESVTKPKHFLTFHTVASVQKSGEVVAQQSSTSTQP